MDELRIHIVSYNVAVRSPEGDVSNVLGLNTDGGSKIILPDFILIGLQEVKAQPQNYLMDTLFSDPWSLEFRKSLANLGYVKVKTVRLVGIILSFYCLRKHIPHLRDIQSICTRTGLMGLWGNKGGVSLRLQIHGCSLCFVNCHLAAHDHLVKERIADYYTILDNQKFNCKESTSIMFHDYVFWFGDLNFRLSNEPVLTASEINDKISKKQYSELLKHDQLSNLMASGEAFSELIEAPITFPPTYKYYFRSPNYDLGRRPGWTDRVLYKVNAHVYENVTLNCSQISYKAIDSADISDHRPVVANFVVKVFSDYVERAVKFLPIQDWFTEQENKAAIVLSSDVDPSPWDWVGVFHEDFTSLDDYIGFIYLPTEASDTITPKVARNGDRIELRFFESITRTPGKYRLIYFKHDSSSILGVSPEFIVKNKENTSGTVSLDW